MPAIDGSVVVRRVDVSDPSDAGALAALRYEWRATQAEAPIEVTGADFATRFVRWLREHAASHLAWLATKDGAPIGIVFLALTERIPGPDRWLRRSGNLQSLYVTPAHRGAGIGAALCEQVIAEARRQQLDYLVVHPSARAFPLYRRLGFAVREGTLELDLRQPPGGGG